MKIGIGNMIGRYVIEVYDTTPSAPIVFSAEVNSASPRGIKISFDKQMDINPDDAIYPSTTSVIIKRNGIEESCGGIGGDGNTYYFYALEETGEFVQSDIISVSYIKPDDNFFKSVDGVALESFVDYPVTNNIEPL